MDTDKAQYAALGAHLTKPAQPAPTCAYEQECRALFVANWIDHPGLLSFMRPRCATLIKPVVTEEAIRECQEQMGFAP